LLGYNAVAPADKTFTIEEIYTLNADGEIPELMTIYAEEELEDEEE